MTRHRLDDDTWGFESSCVASERRNERGRQIPFVRDDERSTEPTGDDAWRVKD